MTGAVSRDPWSLGSVDGYAPPAPPAYGTPETDAAIDEVVDVSANLTGLVPVLHVAAVPAYVSGHASTTSAGAELLKLYTGNSAYGDSETIKAGSSKVEPGVTPAAAVVLHWSTFDAVASEVADSRLYDGVHFRGRTRPGWNKDGGWPATSGGVQKYFDGTA